VKGWRADAIREANGILDLAIEKDPDFALAYALKSVLLGVGTRLSFWRDDDANVRELALEAADKALALDESDSNVLGFAGCTLADYGEHERSRPILDKAIELDPSNAQAFVARAAMYSDLKEFDLAIADCKQGLSLSPRDPRQAGWSLTYVTALMHLGQVERAYEVAQYACRRDTRNFSSWVTLAVCALVKGEPDVASNAIREAQHLRRDLNKQDLQKLVGRSVLKLMEESGILDWLKNT